MTPDQIEQERASDTPLAVTTAPKEIYLQIGDDADQLNYEFPLGVDDEITWCVDSVLNAEVKYVRADLYEQLERELAEARKDRLTLALRLCCEDTATFAPETLAVMERMEPEIQAALDATRSEFRAAIDAARNKP